MDARFRSCGIGLLLTLATCLPASADEAVADTITQPHGAGLQDAAEGIADTAPQSLPLEELQMFADVFNQIRQGYVESVPDSELFELAVQGMLSGLDPHSVFLQEKAYDSLQETTQGEFSGLGIEIGQDRGYITIIAPIDASPLAEIVPTWAISSDLEIFFALARRSSQTSFDALSIPRFRSIGFMPAATRLRPSRTMA